MKKTKAFILHSLTQKNAKVEKKNVFGKNGKKVKCSSFGAHMPLRLSILFFPGWAPPLQLQSAHYLPSK
jgi:hypothetical protein